MGCCSVPLFWCGGDRTLHEIHHHDQLMHRGILIFGSPKISKICFKTSIRIYEPTTSDICSHLHGMSWKSPSHLECQHLHFTWTTTNTVYIDFKHRPSPTWAGNITSCSKLSLSASASSCRPAARPIAMQGERQERGGIAKEEHGEGGGKARVCHSSSQSQSEQ